MAFKRLFSDTSGATAVEYALIAGLISIAALTGAGEIGTRINQTWTIIADALSGDEGGGGEEDGDGEGDG